MIFQMEHYSTDVMLEVNRKFCSGPTHMISKCHAVAHENQCCSGPSLMVTVFTRKQRIINGLFIGCSS